MELKIKKVNRALALKAIVEIVNQVMKHDFSLYQPRTRRAYGRLFDHAYFRKFIKEENNVVLAAFDQERLAGFVSVKGDSGGVAFIDWLAVIMPYRRHGLGTRLLKQAEDWSLHHGFHYLHLLTEAPANIAYYLKRGFRLVGVHRGAWFGEDEKIMAKKIRDNPFPQVFSGK
ncbi:GNAT family N-acetyltransferase [Patescibacteria group bacterium]|nr:GNAT family N-acetyltransferase [Patescibacteria group bacterium]MCL5091664.1 GNAT family N-acetyltransferase [Patescibacteria group bacterium]